jgi:hypothetical protein
MLRYIVGSGCICLGYMYKERLSDYTHLCFISALWMYCKMEVRFKRIMKSFFSKNVSDIYLYHRGNVIQMSLDECMSLDSHNDSIVYSYCTDSGNVSRYFENLSDMKMEYNTNRSLRTLRGPRQIISATLYDTQNQSHNVTPSKLTLEAIGNKLYTNRFVHNLCDIHSTIQYYTIHIMDDAMNEYTLHHTCSLRETLQVTEEGFLIQRHQ